MPQPHRPEHASLTLVAGTYERLRARDSQQIGWRDGLLLLGERIGELGKQVLAAAGSAAPGAHLICSTYLTPLALDDPALSQSFLARISHRCGVEPAAVITMYQCASWGFALRFALRQSGARRVLLTIADWDLHSVVRADADFIWGDSGFGISTLLFDLEGTPSDCLRVSSAHVDVALSHFAREFSEFCKQKGSATAFGPFFPPHTWETFARVVRRFTSLAPNRHDAHGHSFGSDPWIGLIESLASGQTGSEGRVSVGSLALHGYYAMAQVAIAPDSPGGPAARRFWLTER